ncbi:hypothetical protein GH714_035348 [Hevea brasiliensis]|uniref:Uncharacterized protein n=1 Tax=Hevea brasiliensis TaxID=3981 RepID=A0A6A6NAE8_HEVBR|nr:hypothetical protein GH714_035348 [Hevea brasiliensis]
MFWLGKDEVKGTPMRKNAFFYTNGQLMICDTRYATTSPARQETVRRPIRCPNTCSDGYCVNDGTFTMGTAWAQYYGYSVL